MIEYSCFTLPNGLKVLVDEDRTTPLVSLALVYNVGSSDEDIEHTGFAHLFEHLMFGGSVNIPDLDCPLEFAGGTNNAFTSSDITCYYCTLPAENIETALWLESDRMLSLAFTDTSLEVQRKVVIEEFKQNYLNAPYGDVHHLLSALSYKVHPYRWPTIGLTPQHVEEATMQQVKEFFSKHYMPNNAVLALSGNISQQQAESLVEKWFGDIPAGIRPKRNLPIEPPQLEERLMEVERAVPANALFMVFPMCALMDEEYLVFDTISDLLSNGASSRLVTRLLEREALFSSIDAVVSGSRDAGSFIFSGILSPGVSYEQAEAAIWREIEDLQTVTDQELEKIKNKFEAAQIFSHLKASNRARKLAEYETLGNADYVNTLVQRQRAVTRAQVLDCLQQHFNRYQCSTLRYKSNL